MRVATTLTLTFAVALTAVVDLMAQTRTITRATAPALLTRIAPPPPGPPPQGLGFDSQETFGVFAKVTWQAAPNAVGYSVTRAKRDDPNCCNTASGPLPPASTSWGDAGLYQPGYYRYTVAVQYADGSSGSQAIDLGVLSGVAPAPVTVQDMGPGRVRINYNYQSPGIMGVVISGPGFGKGLGGVGQKTLSSLGPIDLSLPAGTHHWKLAMVMNGSRLTFPIPSDYQVSTNWVGTKMVVPPSSGWADLSHTVSYGSGRFRISLERFEAGADVAEDLLRGDGRGNEIYITTQVTEFHGRNSSLGPTRMLRTPTFGDVQNYPNRVRAGSMSPTGGVRANDGYPAAVQLVSQLAPATTTNLPFVLWEGDLTEVDGAVLLSPAIWEADEDDRLFPQLMTFLLGAVGNGQYPSILKSFLPSSGLSRTVLDTWRPTTGNDCLLPHRFQPAGPFGDQPVDLSPNYSYCPTYVAINWQVANSFTSVNPAMVVDIPYHVSVPAGAGGPYRLYIRVEKVTAPTAVVAPTQFKRRVP
ncbi:MAG: hypothetical protein ACKVZ0_14560 [Gemmatimonadales bacterium]